MSIVPKSFIVKNVADWLYLTNEKLLHKTLPMPKEEGYVLPSNPEVLLPSTYENYVLYKEEMLTLHLGIGVRKALGELGTWTATIEDIWLGSLVAQFEADKSLPEYVKSVHTYVSELYPETIGGFSRLLGCIVDKCISSPNSVKISVGYGANVILAVLEDGTAVTIRMYEYRVDAPAGLVVPNGDNLKHAYSVLNKQ